MDFIHKLSVAALISLVIITAGMLVQHQLELQQNAGTTNSPEVDLKKLYTKKIADNKILYAEVIKLLAQRQTTAATAKLAEIKTAHPDNPETFIFQAKLEEKDGRMAAAIHSYRMAVDIEPDYVDKKTPLFIGDGIMEMITSARTKLQREKKLKPGDKSINIALEDIYYLQRRIAGGCE